MSSHRPSAPVQGLHAWLAWEPNPVVVPPPVTAAYRKYQSQGFEVIGISLNHDPARLAALVKEYDDKTVRCHRRGGGAASSPPSPRHGRTRGSQRGTDAE
jgi:hypothetical protein